MPSVVRVLMHFHTERGLRDVDHVYLDGAEALRDDLERLTRRLSGRSIGWRSSAPV